jgi:site-specific recombinase XerC
LAAIVAPFKIAKGRDIILRGSPERFTYAGDDCRVGPEAGIVPTFRHPFATEHLEDHHDVSPGAPRHQDVSTTVIYTHVLNRGPSAVWSPLDRMVDGERR